MTRRQKRPTPANRSHELRHRILEYFPTLRIPMAEDELDAVLAEAEKQQWSPLELLMHVLGPQADLRRQRAIERRIRDAHFREPVTLEGFDWGFNAKAIDRVVDGAIILKIEGRSYRASRLKRPVPDKDGKVAKPLPLSTS
jgi:hypothetical protein